jgi:hypothetical protein
MRAVFSVLSRNSQLLLKTQNTFVEVVFELRYEQDVC